MAVRLGGLCPVNRRGRSRLVHSLSQVSLCTNGPSDAVLYASFPDQVDLSLSCAIVSETVLDMKVAGLAAGLRRRLLRRLAGTGPIRAWQEEMMAPLL